jgi:UDP-N-acetylglucosamine--N-acetylmuramyl-(pentapeptide) pyrophosphoryl-undecaprenol N-acetylglucosamine transferase
MRVMVVGGGSAGHVIPALPVMAALQAQGAEVLFVGTSSGLEESLVAPAGVNFAAISAGKLRRYFSWQNFTDLFRIVIGIVQAWLLIGRYKPDVVFSKGGFVSFPVAFAAWLRRVPVVAHESDITPGLANRLVLPFVATLCVSFPPAEGGPDKPRIVHTGTPLRSEILAGEAERGRALLGLPGNKPLLVVTGGSLGADALNAVVRDALEPLLERFEIVHVCGAGKQVDIEAKGYVQREFVSAGWGDMLAAADVVLSRAGANALFELLALGKLHLLVPLSAKASRGDQLANAAYARKHGYSAVLYEEDLDAHTLVQALAELMRNRAAYTRAMTQNTQPDATAAIVHELNQFTG